LKKMELSFRANGGQIELETNTTMVFSLLKAGIPTFFHDKHITLRSDLDFDTIQQKLNITEGHLGLEEAKFSATGSLVLSEQPDFDLTVSGEKPDFTLFTSFAPPEVASIISQYSEQGRVFFEGTVKGRATKDQQPALEFKFGCDNGIVENIKAKRAIDQLEINGRFTNGEKRNLSTSVFELRNFSFRPARGNFKGNLLVRDFTNPQVALTLMSDLDLNFLAEFLQISQVKNLMGNVQLNMNFSELVDIEKPENSLMKLKEGIESELIIKNLSFALPQQALSVDRVNAHAEMKAGKLTLDSLSIKVGSSDINFSGMISDVPALFHKPNKNVSLRLNTWGNKIVVRDLLQGDSTLARTFDEELDDFEVKMGFETSVAKLKKQPLPLGEFFIDDLHATLKGYPHRLHDLRADIIVTDSSFQLKNFSGEIDQSDFHFNGRLVNYALWFDSVKRGDTRFEFDLYSEQLKLHNLLTYKGESYLPKDYQDEVIKELKLHGFTDLYFDRQFKSADLLVNKVEGKMRVHPIKLEQLKGRIHFEDEHLTVQNLSAKMGSSDFNINLAFYTGKNQELKKRDNKFSIQSTFLNLDELLNFDLEKPKTSADHAKAFNIFEVPFTDMQFNADIGKIKHHHILLEQMTASLRMKQNHYLYFDTIQFKTAGGKLAMKGYFNGSDPKKIYLKSDSKFENMNLDQLLFKFDNFGQDALVSNNLHGQLTGTVSSMIRVHHDLAPILNEGEAHMDILILNGSLNNFAPLQAMAGYFKDKNINKVRFDTLQNKLDLKNGVLNIPAMTINSSLGFIEMQGSQSLDLKMDYLIRIPWKLVTQVGVRALFGGKNKEEVDPEQVDAIQYRDKDKRVRFLNVRVKGTPDKFDFSLGKK
ncbi:MAG: AsmA-like C-terminal region-containing protein, partial [Flammeovirgaceae bacterium]